MEGGAGRVRTPRTHRTHHADLQGCTGNNGDHLRRFQKEEIQLRTSPRTYWTDVFLPARARNWGRNKSILLMCARVTDRDASGASAMNSIIFPANVTTDHVPPERGMDTEKTSSP